MKQYFQEQLGLWDASVSSQSDEAHSSGLNLSVWLHGDDAKECPVGK